MACHECFVRFLWLRLSPETHLTVPHFEAFGHCPERRMSMSQRHVVAGDDDRTYDTRFLRHGNEVQLAPCMADTLLTALPRLTRFHHELVFDLCILLLRRGYSP